MWRNFHALRGSELNLTWKSFLTALDLDHNNDPPFMQCILDECFKFVVKKKFKTVQKSTTVEELSEGEHNALRYIAGYVPFFLIKKLTKGSNTNKDQFIKCLSQMKI